MPHHLSRSSFSSWLFSVVTGTTCSVLLRDIVVDVDVSFLRGYPYTGVIMVACDGLGEFCVVLRAVLFFIFDILRPELFLLILLFFVYSQGSL